MSDIAKLLWPKSVAIVGASSDTRGLRGRIVQIMRSNPYQGALYPVSRSEGEVQGLQDYKSVAELPPTDLAAMIIPAKFVPQELENCGKAGIKAAIILSSGFAEEKGETGPALQREVQAIAEDAQENLDVFRGRDASQEHHVAVVADLLGEHPRTPLQGPAIRAIGGRKRDWR